MAKDKKSFLLYCDTIHTVDKLSNEKAGELFKHILAYVNDLNPTPNDFIIELAFEPIKQSLKRDLIKYEGKRLKNKNNANKRWHTDDATACDRMRMDANDAVSDSVIDSVSVNDSVNKKDIRFDFKKSLLNLGIEKRLATEWLEVRKKKKLTNTQTAFEDFAEELKKTGANPNTVLKLCVVKSWGGLKADWYKNEISKQQMPHTPQQPQQTGLSLNSIPDIT